MPDTEYVLGTGDAELQRLGLQHSVWRADAALAWRAADFVPGQTIIDVGCGPGFATLDLADVVGPSGRVIGIDQSARFLEHLRQMAAARDARNVSVVQADLTTHDFAGLECDGAWLRWVLAFVPEPRDVLARLTTALRPGATIAIHEYHAYETWKLVPADPVFESFVAAVMASWRKRGGEPNVGLSIVPWLEELGYTIESTRTIAELVSPEQHRWHWPAAFARSGLERLIALGDASVEEGAAMRASIDALWRNGTRMMTPAVVEVVARRSS